MADNSAALKRGFSALRKKIDDSFYAAMLTFAKDALASAVTEWLSNQVDLTNNMANGYVAGVFKDGKMVTMLYADDVRDVESPTDSFAMSGHPIRIRDDRLNAQYEQENPAWILEYRKNSGLHFQNTALGQNALEYAYSWMKDYKARSRGLEVVVAATAPYAGYLMEKRKLDVIMKTYSSNKEMLERALSTIKR